MHPNDSDSPQVVITTIRETTVSPLPDPIRTPEKVDELIRPLVESETREHLYAIHLDSRSRLKRVELVTLGSSGLLVIRPRDIFWPAFEHSGRFLVLAHNHPSGDPEPSRPDFIVTQRIIRAGRILGIPLLDHVILGADSFCSFIRSGLMEEPELWQVRE